MESRKVDGSSKSTGASSAPKVKGELKTQANKVGTFASRSLSANFGTAGSLKGRVTLGPVGQTTKVRPR